MNSIENGKINGNLHAYAHDDKACIERFINIVHSNFAFTRENASSKNSLKKYLQQIETFIFKSLNIKKLENIDKYSGNLIKDIIEEYTYKKIQKNVLRKCQPSRLD